MPVEEVREEAPAQPSVSVSNRNKTLDLVMLLAASGPIVFGTKLLAKGPHRLHSALFARIWSLAHFHDDKNSFMAAWLLRSFSNSTPDGVALL